MSDMDEADDSGLGFSILNIQETTIAEEEDFVKVTSKLFGGFIDCRLGQICASVKG